MMEGRSRLARAEVLVPNPTVQVTLATLHPHELEEAIACFPEVDTETASNAPTRISYLVQRLRMCEPPGLDGARASGRRFLLDMLGHLALPSSAGQGSEPPLASGREVRYRHLVWLLERSAAPELGAAIAESKGIGALSATDLSALCRWAHAHGLSPNELALIQPDYFEGGAPVGQGLQPRAWALVAACRQRVLDYLDRVFSSMTDMAEASARVVSTRGQALASVFELEADHRPLEHGRLKVFLQGGMVAAHPHRD